jgi:soluble lytic murein transglycosylase-like protein
VTEYRAEIEAAASVARLDPDLVEALVMIESSGRADAFRHEPAYLDKYIRGKAEWARWQPRRVASSYGLCQLMFPTARGIGFSGEPEELFVPKVNLYWGCKLLAKLLSWSKGNEAKALAAFNGGMGNWKAAEPQAYAGKVLTELERARRTPRT